ncbi:Ribonuclease 2 [Platanthera guangdongensis]|uniref:Ribonuclease 2 n=1 Tax=Platanthera guangdongensis TaxID=2320717 RepID=A0ABR2M882_9ASPA
MAARRAFNAQSLLPCLSVFLIILYTTAAVAAVTDVLVASIASGEAAGHREFDYFSLALQWPGTYCQRTRHCCSSSACCLYSFIFLACPLIFLLTHAVDQYAFLF